ncbi:MAG: class I fructose-bisphosphate aldolase [bacterium]|nr:class I fructose-bisphosphate aldolase [bacterium]
MITAEQRENLKKVAQQMVAPGKGILAADESTGTCEKKFAKAGIPCTEDSRRAYRELFFTASGIGEYISGVILYDETIRQNASDGRSFVSVLQQAGVLPGIKVDQGVKEMDLPASSTRQAGGSPNEKVTKGLNGLPDRLKEYAKMGAKFAKWRAVITIGEGLPTDANIRQNAKDLAAYARDCQEAGIVPIVEPEVLMDGSHDISACRDASKRTLTALFEELEKAGVAIDGIILKTNMVIPAKDCPKQATPEEIAEATLGLFKKVLPKELVGQAFLSGGQSEEEATANLDAINKKGPLPWKMSFSYGRALQNTALKVWNGKAENVPAAQKAFLHRAKMNSLATLGKYSKEMEAT